MEKLYDMNPISTINKTKTDLSTRIEELGRFVGNTPLFPIRNLHENRDVRIYAKLEWQQFGNSVKARPAWQIVKDAIEQGLLEEGKTLLDASSGNTGIAYAHIGAALGIPVTLCLPENASEERRQILKALGVTLNTTSKMGGTDEAQDVARDLYESKPDKFFYADQYGNENNWKAHYHTTGSEIWRQTEGEVTHFITGLGTTGTFVGTGRKLREYDSGIRLISVQPDLAMHGLEGWKHLETAQVPAIYDSSLADENRILSTEAAHETMKMAAAKEGLLLSPSSSANLSAALTLARELNSGTIVTIFPDDGSKYGEVIRQLFK